MPRDANGNTQPLPGTIVATGDTVLPSQHNPAMVDLYAMMTQSLSRDGQGGMRTNLDMSGFRLTNLANGTSPSDAATVSQVDAAQTAGLIYGLRCSVAAGDPSNDITVQGGVCASVLSGYALMTLGTITKRLDAGWSAGTNQGMLDTGVVQNTSYHLYVIKNMSSGVVDLIASLNSSAPSLPAGYTQYRRIWSIIRESGANRQFRQYGDMCKCTSVNAISGVIAYGPTLTNMRVPTGLALQPIFTTSGLTNASSGLIVSAGDADFGGVQAVVATCGLNAVADVLTNGGFWVNTNGQLVTSMTGSPVSFSIDTLGWIDNRGRYGANG